MRMYEGKVTFAVVGLGGRASAYLAALREFYPDGHAVMAVADPDPKKRLRAAQEYAVPESGLFETDLELMEQPRLADVAIVGTQDALHYRETVALLEKGYDIILEKPISTKMDELLDLRRRAAAYPNQMVAVCHVLRHTAFFSRIRQIIESGKLGRVVTIQHNENIGYYHFAHSYVRGPWKCADTSGPLAITKSCHDMDILLYLLGADSHAQRVASFGSLGVFRPERFDSKTMAPRCIDCPQQAVCPYSAVRIYSSKKIKSVVFDMSSVEQIRQSLGDTPYGRCVYQAGNNVVDHQSTILSFAGGVTATFNLSAFTAKVNRSLKVMCEYGEIRAAEKPYCIETTSFFDDSTEQEQLDIAEGGHGGGDKAFMQHFMQSYLRQIPFSTTLENSIESHVMSLLAERSRLAGGEPQDVEAVMGGFRQ